MFYFENARNKNRPLGIYLTQITRFLHHISNETLFTIKIVAHKYDNISFCFYFHFSVLFYLFAIKYCHLLRGLINAFKYREITLLQMIILFSPFLSPTNNCKEFSFFKNYFSKEIRFMK